MFSEKGLKRKNVGSKNSNSIERLLLEKFGGFGTKKLAVAEPIKAVTKSDILGPGSNNSQSVEVRHRMIDTVSNISSSLKETKVGEKVKKAVTKSDTTGLGSNDKQSVESLPNQIDRISNNPNSHNKPKRKRKSGKLRICKKVVPIITWKKSAFTREYLDFLEKFDWSLLDGSNIKRIKGYRYY